MWTRERYVHTTLPQEVLESRIAHLSRQLVSINVTARSIPRLPKSKGYQAFALVATGPGLVLAQHCKQCEPGTHIQCYIPNGLGTNYNMHRSGIL